jgi:hypothetical protein
VVVSKPIRASDAEREATAARLEEAVTEGRLDLPTFEERVAAANAATDRAELEKLTADLPESPADAATREWFREWRFWLGGALVMSVIWGVECLRKGDLIWPWPVAPLAIWAAVLVTIALSDRPGRN